MPLRSGIDPENLLLDKYSSERLGRLVKLKGMGPVNEFLSRRITSKVCTSSSVEGKLPLSWLLSKSTCMRLIFELKRFDGIPPVN